METQDKTKLLEALKKGTVTVSFTKLDTGDLRVMPCTLNPAVLEANNVKNSVSITSADTESFPVWSLDKDAWRSFRLDTVTGWEVLGE
ncbi:MAG: SH3 beta-barrel fold-containing protein [Methylophagaceae bacterium]